MGQEALSQQQVDAITSMSDRLTGASHYDVLGVGYDSSHGDVRKAYYSLSKEWHPDRFYRHEIGDHALVLEQIFMTITQAYQVLSDTVERSSYNSAQHQIVREREEKERLKRVRNAKSAGARRQDGGSSASRSSSYKQGSSHSVTFQRPRKSTAEPYRPSSSTTSTAKPAETNVPPQILVEEPESLADDQTMEAPNKVERTRRAHRSQSRPNRGANKSKDIIKQRSKERRQRAKSYYQQGKKELAEGHVMQAQSSLQIALSFAPKNESVKKLYDQVTKQAHSAKSLVYIAQAESAESFRNHASAEGFYRQAVDCDPDSGVAFFRLALLLLAKNAEDKEAVRLLRQAVTKVPTNSQYRVELGKMYTQLGMGLNAKREFQQVLKNNPGHSEAKALLKKV